MLQRDEHELRCPKCYSAKVRSVKVEEDRWFYCATCDNNFKPNGHAVVVCKDDRCTRDELHLEHLPPKTPLTRGGDRTIPVFCPNCGDKVLKHEDPPRCRSCEWRRVTTEEARQAALARWLECPLCVGRGTDGMVACEFCNGSGTVHRSQLRIAQRYKKGRGLAK